MTAQEEIADIKRKIKAREGQYGYADTIKAMKARIAKLEAEINE